jgi:hypothetical protein
MCRGLMRVSIEVKEISYEEARRASVFNFLSKSKTIRAWRIATRVDLTEEERAVLIERNLWDKKLYDMNFSPDHFTNRDRLAMGNIKSAPITIADVFETETHDRYAYDPVEAKQVAQEMRTVVLPRLKAIIKAGTDIPSSTTFEL